MGCGLFRNLGCWLEAPQWRHLGWGCPPCALGLVCGEDSTGGHSVGDSWRQFSLLLPRSAGVGRGLVPGPCLLSTLRSAALGPPTLPTENPPPWRVAERMFRGEVTRESAEREPAGTGVQDEGGGGCQRGSR